MDRDLIKDTVYRLVSDALYTTDRFHWLQTSDITIQRAGPIDDINRMVREHINKEKIYVYPFDGVF